jgi:nitrogenase subunit NifH
MPDKLLIATIFIAIVGVIAGVAFYDTQVQQPTEIYEDYSESLGQGMIQVIVFDTDLESAKKTLFNEYKNYEIVSYEILDEMIIFTIKEVK